jgi:hypothetical protein
LHDVDVARVVNRVRGTFMEHALTAATTTSPAWADAVESIDAVSDALRAVLSDVEPRAAGDETPTDNVVQLTRVTPNPEPELQVEREAA